MLKAGNNNNNSSSSIVLIEPYCEDPLNNPLCSDSTISPARVARNNTRNGLLTHWLYRYACVSPSGDRFIVAKEKERSEVKVKKGPEGFPFLKGEKYIFSYSFRAVEGMKVSKRFTFLGQLKGSKDGYMIKGDPIYSLTANNHGLNVRFRYDGTVRECTRLVNTFRIRVTALLF